MKSYNAAVLALSLAASTAAAPQFSIPSLSLPTGGFGSGSLTGLGSLPSLGSGSGLGSLGSGSIPSLGSGSGLGSLGSGSLTSLGSGLGSGSGTLSTAVATAASSSATATASGIAKSTSAGGSPSSYSGSGDTANDVTDNTGCREATVIFARGTSETGNMGTIAGPPLAKALFGDLSTSSVSVQGVDYPASASGNANLGADGGPTMAKLVSQSLSQCPDSKIVLSGYSQGAMVVHNAVSDQGVDAGSIAAVVLFGDPFNGQSVGSVATSKVKEFCASGDSVCASGGAQGTGSGTGHLSYGGDAQAAADFVKPLV